MQDYPCKCPDTFKSTCTRVQPPHSSPLRPHPSYTANILFIPPNTTQTFKVRRSELTQPLLPNLPQGETKAAGELEQQRSLCTTLALHLWRVRNRVLIRFLAAYFCCFAAATTTPVVPVQRYVAVGSEESNELVKVMEVLKALIELPCPVFNMSHFLHVH